MQRLALCIIALLCFGAASSTKPKPSEAKPHVKPRTIIFVV